MCSVLVAKCIPDHRQRERRELDEVASSCNVIEGSFQFEQERSARLEANKWSLPTGLSEIDLIGLQVTQEVEPFVVGDT